MVNKCNAFVIQEDCLIQEPEEKREGGEDLLCYTHSTQPGNRTFAWGSEKEHIMLQWLPPSENDLNRPYLKFFTACKVATYPKHRCQDILYLEGSFNTENNRISFMEARKLSKAVGFLYLVGHLSEKGRLLSLTQLSPARGFLVRRINRKPYGVFTHFSFQLTERKKSDPKNEVEPIQPST